MRLEARAVLLATGGLGRVFLETTNPDVATGDGVAAAWRAGAEISDIEFVQFHPTALHVEGAPRFLLSEALRGEGAYLRNAAGERFMDRYHEMKELAPRDVVSRSIVAEMRRTGSPHVFLDLTHLDAAHIRERFPRIYQTCLHYHVDISRDPVPVHPAAHYAMGGVRTDLEGRTNLKRLYAAGEARLHGRAWREPAGEQFAARRRGLRRSRGGGDAERSRRRVHRGGRSSARGVPERKRRRGAADRVGAMRHHTRNAGSWSQRSRNWMRWARLRRSSGRGSITRSGTCGRWSA